MGGVGEDHLRLRYFELIGEMAEELTVGGVLGGLENRLGRRPLGGARRGLASGEHARRLARMRRERRVNDAERFQP